MIRKARPRINSQLIVRTWPRRLVLPTPEFPMITTLIVRMGNDVEARGLKILLSVPLGASQ